MLVLTRRKEDIVVITPPGGSPITIQVLDIRGGKVRLGFDAEKDVIILRSELMENPPGSASDFSFKPNPFSFRPGRDS